MRFHSMRWHSETQRGYSELKQKYHQRHVLITTASEGHAWGKLVRENFVTTGKCSHCCTQYTSCTTTRKKTSLIPQVVWAHGTCKLSNDSHRRRHTVATSSTCVCHASVHTTTVSYRRHSVGPHTLHITSNSDTTASCPATDWCTDALLYWMTSYCYVPSNGLNARTC